MDYKEFRERYQYDAAKDLLGQGGFGRVFKARDTLLDRWVALKVFSRDVPEQYDLISEIRRAIDFNHRNICRYYGAEVLKGADALGDAQVIQVGIMDFIEGGTIDDFLRRNPQHRKKLLADVLRGLSYLHQHRPAIIHRDLKPPNVLVSMEDGVPVAKITDFGIAKTSRETGVKISRLIGTMAYMAPEQLNPVRYGVNGNIQCNLDLWSFGAMTMELLTGKLPFGAGDPGASTGQIQEAIIHGVSEKELNGFEEPFRSVLRRCMVQDAGKRAQSAAELLSLFDDPQQFAGDQRRRTAPDDARKRSVTVPERTPEPPKPVPAPRPTPVIPEPAPGPKRPSRVKWIFLAFVALVAVATAVNTFLQQSNSRAQPQPQTSTEAPVQTPDFQEIARKADWFYDQKRYAEAEPLYDQACNGGEAHSCVRLGAMFKEKWGVAQDYPRAVSLFSKGCDAGIPAGCSDLGMMYEQGHGVTEDHARAAALFTKGCDAGNAAGCSGLGWIYLYGEGVPEDNARALALFYKGCEAGNAFGCSSIGQVYRDGRGVEKDTAKAREQFSAGCKMGDSWGCDQLKEMQ